MSNWKVPRGSNAKHACLQNPTKSYQTIHKSVQHGRANSFIHMDIQVMEETSCRAYHYLLVIMDDATRCRFASPSPCKTKGETSKQAIKFAETVKNNTGSYPQEYRLDKGSEFSDFVKWAKKKGSTFKLSPAYTHEPNGAIENAGKYIVQTGRAMTIGPNAPESMWPEACKTAAISPTEHETNCEE